MQFLRVAFVAAAMAASSSTMVFAQFADPMVALAGGNGAMTCGQFTHLSAGHRAAIARGLNASAPPASLSPVVPVITPGRPGGRINRPVAPPVGTVPLTAGALVAACQAAAPGESLRSAYGQFNSGQTVVRRHHRR